MPNDLPPWHIVYDQMQRWIKAGMFEAMMHDLRALLRLAERRPAQLSAAILDSRTLQSSPESGARAGHDGAKRKRQERLCATAALGHRAQFRLDVPLSAVGPRLRAVA